MKSPQGQEGGTSAQALRMNRYYAFHSRIYDMTRWSFLFGRAALPEIAGKHIEPKNILEVGCGTGKNLLNFAGRFRDATVAGLDVSADMIEIAEKKSKKNGRKITFIKGLYDQPLSKKGQKFDLILFSYCLSMINPGWENALECAKEDLLNNGLIVVADFNKTMHPWFAGWMAANHVQMRGLLPEKLGKMFKTEYLSENSAYFGLWEYFIFAGRKEACACYFSRKADKKH
jgi:S-adenosylmethionine-diacylgycerolhomoserine-N-methlytransferase